MTASAGRPGPGGADCGVMPERMACWPDRRRRDDDDQDNIDQFIVYFKVSRLSLYKDYVELEYGDITNVLNLPEYIYIYIYVSLQLDAAEYFKGDPAKSQSVTSRSGRDRQVAPIYCVFLCEPIVHKSCTARFTSHHHPHHHHHQLLRPLHRNHHNDHHELFPSPGM
jgi:hypothetical protein